MKSQPSSPVEVFKRFVREKYAWPGGYPCFALMDDGEALCHSCVGQHAKLILRATQDKDRSGWNCVGVDVNWEDNDLRCAHCSGLIESAYGELQ